MPGPSLYLFLDEGGNFDFSTKGTAFFTLTSVSKTRPFQTHQELSNLKYDLIELGLALEHFHASEDRQAVRNQVFEILKKHLGAMRIDTLIIEKAKTGPALQPEEKFYPRMMGYLLRHAIGKQDLSGFSSVIVVTDTLPFNRKRQAVEKAIKTHLTRILASRVPYRVLHHESKSSFGRQLADYCNWAIYRKWNTKDTRSYDIIKTSIKSEFDIFQTGVTRYY